MRRWPELDSKGTASAPVDVETVAELMLKGFSRPVVALNLVRLKA
jgi:hypothetical protein